MIYWYYVYSPKYEIFHRALFNMISKCHGITVCPINIKESAFNKTFRDNKPHFYTGISIKEKIIYAALQDHKDDYIIFSDVDIIVNDSDLINYLENYKCNDMTFLMESEDPLLYNPGFSLIKSTDETIKFFGNVVKNIDENDIDDMSAINYELNTRKSFNGKVGVFSLPDVINTDKVCDTYTENKIIHCAYNDTVEIKVMCHKLLTFGLFTDVISNNDDILVQCEQLNMEKCINCDGNNNCMYWFWNDDNNNTQLLCPVNSIIFDHGISSIYLKSLKIDKVCKYFDKTQILFTHKYQHDSEIKTFNNVRFRSQPVNNQLITNIGLVNNLILNTTNKSFSWYSNKKMGDELVDSTKDTYFNLIYNKEIDIVIDEPVFLFMDYESTTSTSHAYDLQFFLLYKYCNSDIKCKLLVVKSENKYYNKLLKLIKDNYDIEYLYIDTNVNYRFSTFYSIQSHYNIFFDYVKTFINETLIKKIMLKYSSQNAPYYDNLCKIKYQNPDLFNMNNSNFKSTEEFANYCSSNNILNLDLVDDDEYRIYLLNMSKKVTISWGSNLIINIAYYMLDLSNKEIIIACNKGDHCEDYIKCIDTNTYKLCMPRWHTKGYMDGVYNNLIIKGHLLTGLESDSKLLDVLDNKNVIKMYLAHYNSTLYIEKQVNLIKKFIKYNKETTRLELYGFVDSTNDEMRETMRAKWLELGAIPLDMPKERHEFCDKLSNRINHSDYSYGMAFQHVFDNYIKKDTYISIFMENDFFPINYIDIEKYCEDYKMCGELRINAHYYPNYFLLHMWLGIQIFNFRRFNNDDKAIYNGMAGNININNTSFWTDCGGLTYYWLLTNQNYKNIKHIKEVGYKPLEHNPLNIDCITLAAFVKDINELPVELQEKYRIEFKVCNYDNLFLHLVSCFYKHPAEKLEWLDIAYNKLMLL